MTHQADSFADTFPEVLWVFAYGSLMWKPGFDYAASSRARLDGYRRSFCMWSIHHRGTQENPGLVLALDPDEDAGCEGVAFQVPSETRTDVLRYLRERELISSAYQERLETIRLADGQEVQALAYVMNRDHVQYTGQMTAAEKAAIIARSSGGMGPNDEYLFSTLSHLRDMGCPDPEMEEIARLIQRAKSGQN